MDAKFPVRLTVALLKDGVSKVLGDETVAVLADVGGHKAQERFDAWLLSADNQKALSRAMNQADACFQENAGDDKLRQWMHDLPLRDLPALQEALAALPAHADENALEDALRQAIARDWPSLNQAQRDLAVRLYLLCLRRALLPLEKQALQVIGRAVLRTEEMIARLQAELREWLAQQKRDLNQAIAIYGAVYQSVVISGDNNVVTYIVNNFFVGSIWQLPVKQLAAMPLPLQLEEQSYLRILRDESDRLPLAEDERRTHKDTKERVAMHRVYVDLSTTTRPTLADVLNRLEIPPEERPQIKQALTVWLQQIGREEAQHLDVDAIGGYGGMLLKAAGDEDDWQKHPLHRWAQDKETLQQALAPITALEALARQPKLALLGDPGSGKSTFVNHLAFTLAGAMLDDAPDWQPILDDQFSAPLFPLRVVVRRWSGSLSPDPKGEPGLELVYKTLEALPGGMSRKILQVRLNSPHTLVMFDGLDEAPIAEDEGDLNRRRVILESIEQFRTAHPHCRVLVTSRIRPYDNPAYQLADFPTATLDKLDAPRIKRFVRQWYGELQRIGELDETEAQGLGDQLLEAIERRQDLGEMAGTPLLLTMLAVVNRRSGLPESRADLYHEVVRQTQAVLDESLNEPHRLLRMRARPKILSVIIMEMVVLQYFQMVGHYLLTKARQHIPKIG